MNIKFSVCVCVRVCIRGCNDHFPSKTKVYDDSTAIFLFNCNFIQKNIEKGKKKSIKMMEILHFYNFRVVIQNPE